MQASTVFPSAHTGNNLISIHETTQASTRIFTGTAGMVLFQSTRLRKPQRCILCGFGCHLEFQSTRLRKPRQWLQMINFIVPLFQSTRLRKPRHQALFMPRQDDDFNPRGYASLDQGRDKVLEKDIEFQSTRLRKPRPGVSNVHPHRFRNFNPRGYASLDKTAPVFLVTFLISIHEATQASTIIIKYLELGETISIHEATQASTPRLDADAGKSPDFNPRGYASLDQIQIGMIIV